MDELLRKLFSGYENSPQAPHSLSEESMSKFIKVLEPVAAKRESLLKQLKEDLTPEIYHYFLCEQATLAARLKFITLKKPTSMYVITKVFADAHFTYLGNKLNLLYQWEGRGINGRVSVSRAQ